MTRGLSVLLGVGAVIALVVALVIDRLTWRSDWSQFLPELIAATATGLAIGVALWRIQVAGLAAGEKRSVSRAWQAIRGRVQRGLGDGTYTYDPSATTLVAYGSRTIRDIAEGQPLHMWGDHVDDPALGLLIDYLAAADEADQAGSGLIAAINGASRRFDPARGYVNPDARRVALTYLDSKRDLEDAADDDVEEVGAIVTTAIVIEYANAYRAALLLLESLWVDLGAAIRGASWQAGDGPKA